MMDCGVALFGTPAGRVGPTSVGPKPLKSKVFSPDEVGATDRNKPGTTPHSIVSQRQMAENIEKIAVGLGATIVGQVPDVGGGAFGAASLARIVGTMQARLVPGQG